MKNYMSLPSYDISLSSDIYGSDFFIADGMNPFEFSYPIEEEKSATGETLLKQMMTTAPVDE